MNEILILDSFAASVVLSVTYGYDIASHNDIVCDAAKRGTDLFTRVATPERAALFGAVPLRKWLDYSSPTKQCNFVRVVMKLPSWISGLALKDAILSKQYDKDMMDLPYNHVRHNMAS